MTNELNREVVSPLKIVHVGFGKTATTALQLSVLPQLADRLRLEYIKIDDGRIRCHASRLNLGKDVAKPLDAPAGFIVSAEDLHSWDPHFWEEWADKNQQFFGGDSHVLITIREPRSYLTSVYLQMCLHEGNVQSANDLFLTGELYSPYIASAKFAIDDFSYERIINLYKSRFDAVTVVKYESLTEMTFLNEFLALSADELLHYKKLLESEQVNRSYSQRTVKLTFALQKRLNSIGLSLDAATVRGSLICIQLLRDCLAGQSADKSNTAAPPKNVLQMLGMKLVQFFGWSSLVRRLDTYLPYYKFRLEFDALPQIDIVKLMAEYERLAEVQTFRKSGVDNQGANQ